VTRFITMLIRANARQKKQKIKSSKSVKNKLHLLRRCMACSHVACQSRSHTGCHDVTDRYRVQHRATKTPARFTDANVDESHPGHHDKSMRPNLPVPRRHCTTFDRPVSLAIIIMKALLVVDQRRHLSDIGHCRSWALVQQARVTFRVVPSFLTIQSVNPGIIVHPTDKLEHD